MNYFVLFKNAIANVLRGSAAALVAILLPPFLTQIMPNTTYGTWVLILQLSAYVGYLDFGIQTTVGRFVAHANELGDSKQRDRIVSTSFAILTGSAGLGLLLIILLAWQLPNLFYEMPATLYTDARWCLLFVGSSLAIGLPFSVFGGIFIGLQRYEIPAIVIGGSKLVGAVLLIATAKLSANIAYMGLVLATINLLSYGIQAAISYKIANNVQISRRLVSRQTGREIFNYCFSLSIWSFAMLLIGGLDTTLVGFFGFEQVASFSIAATLVTFIAGLQIALFNVLMPASAVMSARSDSQGLGELLVTSTRFGMFVLLLTGLPLLLFAEAILELWVGKEYANEAAILLQILVVANVVRLSAVPYATLLVGTGQQRLIILSPLVEGLTNLVVSVAAGMWFGATGVAIGTLFGSTVAIFCNFMYSMPRSTDIAIKRTIYLRDGLGRPLICAVPVVLMLLSLTLWWASAFFVWFILFLGTFVLVVITFWKVGLVPQEHTLLRLYAVQTYKYILQPLRS